MSILARLIVMGRRVAGLVAGVTAIAGAAPQTSGAQACDTVRSRTTYIGDDQPVIRSVHVRTDAPVSLPIAGAWLATLRRTTETRIVRRQLLFAAGERVDTLAIAETLRRLRDQRLYADVVLEVTRCAGSDSVDITVATRDAWTLRPVGRLVPPATVSVGLEDRNFLGSARALSATNDQTSRGHGGSASYSDPWLFGTSTIGTVRFSDVGGNHLLRAGLRYHETSNFDPWRAEASVARQTFSQQHGAERTLGTLFAIGQVGHELGNSKSAVTVASIGMELDSAQVIEARGGDRSPTTHDRRFIGLNAGLLHRAAQFDTVSWFVPGHGFLDVPRGVEEDVLLSAGSERAQHADALHFDAWAGRVWIPQRGRLVTVDLWMSGFAGDVRANQIDRASLSGYAESAHGYRGGRLQFEQLLQLDPDLRVLSLANEAGDPTLPAVPQAYRLADRALSLSLEESRRVHPIGRSSTLNAALFVAASERWDAPAMGTGRLGVAVVGARLRLLSANGAISSTRLDLSYPVASSRSVVRRPLLSISVAPLFDTSRQRDGRRR